MRIIKEVVLGGVLTLSAAGCVDSDFFLHERSISSEINNVKSPELLMTVRNGYYSGLYYNIWSDSQSENKIVELFDRKNGNAGMYLNVVIYKNGDSDKVIEKRNIDYFPDEIRKLVNF